MTITYDTAVHPTHGAGRIIRRFLHPEFDRLYAEFVPFHRPGRLTLEVPVERLEDAIPVDELDDLAAILGETLDPTIPEVDGGFAPRTSKWEKAINTGDIYLVTRVVHWALCRHDFITNRDKRGHSKVSELSLYDMKLLMAAWVRLISELRCHLDDPEQWVTDHSAYSTALPIRLAQKVSIHDDD